MISLASRETMIAQLPIAFYESQNLACVASIEIEEM